MKLLLVIVVLGAATWYLMMRAKDNASVKQITDSPLQYTKSLQNDEARAKAAAATASKLIQQTDKDVQKAVDAQ
ncbi:MAG: hypothetical protein ACHQ49_18130 [Elusimicrobiota bacterium]